MLPTDRRNDQRPDRRCFARGGRRTSDRPGRHPVVLVADSYAGARVPCARYLQRFGFHVEEAADGEEALARINAVPPHLVVVERGLPQLPARRMIRWLAQNWRTRHIPVIVLAGDADPQDLVEGPDPAPAVLIKPFPLMTMLEEIRRVIRAQGPRPPDLRADA